MQAPGLVVAVSRSAHHTMSKVNEPGIVLITGHGVEGDVHAGSTVKHRSRVRKDPSLPNLRQVHLIPSELMEELRERGFDLLPGQLGENITTQGLDLLALPRGTLLHIGDTAVVEVTGLRNPCAQLDGLMPGLMSAVLQRKPNGDRVRRCGIMGVVVSGGPVQPGARILARLPDPPHAALEPV